MSCQSIPAVHRRLRCCIAVKRHTMCGSRLPLCTIYRSLPNQDAGHDNVYNRRLPTAAANRLRSRHRRGCPKSPHSSRYGRIPARLHAPRKTGRKDRDTGSDRTGRAGRPMCGSFFRLSTMGELLPLFLRSRTVAVSRPDKVAINIVVQRLRGIRREITDPEIWHIRNNDVADVSMRVCSR